jgi:hypothetical protein
MIVLLLLCSCLLRSVCLYVFLIGYGAVAGFNVRDEKPPPHYYGSRVSKKRTVARIRYSREGRKTSATSVKVACICTSDVKPKELDSPLAWGAGVSGRWVRTNGGGSGGREEADKSSGASSAGIRVSVLEERWQWWEY